MKPIQDIWWDIRYYFRNLKRFHKILKEYRDFDFNYIIDLNIFAFTNLKNALVHEADSSRLKKQKKIDELIENFHKLRDLDMIYTTDNAYNEILDNINKILKSQNINADTYEEWEQQFDGSGITGWWD